MQPGTDLRDIDAFKAIIQQYSQDMLLVAYLLLKDPYRASAVVDNVFLDLRAGKFDGEMYNPIERFLIAKIRERCLPFVPDN
ncbi:MAG TPA: hypothetical protein VMH27_13995 [Puia sp.]|nr:hypothetical protein [Puia sp.]